MGCASSKGDINDQHPNIFQVMNVNEDFRPISPGQIEITDTELIFYQRAKNPTTWSLRNLRKYGFDGEIFSFECGRRCATGEGIFAFKCRKAEQLFNLLQHNIQIRNMTEEIHELTTTVAGATTTATNQREVQRRNPSEGYLNPVTNGRPPLSRPGSITSNGPTTPPPIQQTTVSANNQETNNNKNPTVGCVRAVGIRQSSLEHSYLNLTPDVILEAGGHINTPYINVPNAAIVENPSLARNLYMNVDTTLGHQSLNVPAPPITIQEAVREAEDEKNVNETVLLPQLPTSEGSCATCFEDVHCYANIDASTHIVDGESYLGISVPPTPTEVNYVELDLEPSGKNAAGGGPTSAKLKASDSPAKGKSYVTIDFKKTDALSHSINPRLELEEGCRKTRHNSTIGDVRHSSSISD